MSEKVKTAVSYVPVCDWLLLLMLLSMLCLCLCVSLCVLCVRTHNLPTRPAMISLPLSSCSAAAAAAAAVPGRADGNHAADPSSEQRAALSRGLASVRIVVDDGRIGTGEGPGRGRERRRGRGRRGCRHGRPQRQLRPELLGPRGGQGRARQVHNCTAVRHVSGASCSMDRPSERPLRGFCSGFCPQALYR